MPFSLGKVMAGGKVRIVYPNRLKPELQILTCRLEFRLDAVSLVLRAYG